MIYIWQHIAACESKRSVSNKIGIHPSVNKIIWNTTQPSSVFVCVCLRVRAQCVTVYICYLTQQSRSKCTNICILYICRIPLCGTAIVHAIGTTVAAVVCRVVAVSFVFISFSCNRHIYCTLYGTDRPKAAARQFQHHHGRHQNTNHIVRSIPWPAPPNNTNEHSTNRKRDLRCKTHTHRHT